MFARELEYLTVFINGKMIFIGFNAWSLAVKHLHNKSRWRQLKACFEIKSFQTLEKNELIG